MCECVCVCCALVCDGIREILFLLFPDSEYGFHPLCVTNDLSVAICTTFIVILRKLYAQPDAHRTHTNEPFAEEV